MGIATAGPVKQTSCAKVKFVSRDITRWVSLHTALLPWRKIRAQGLRDPLCQFTLQSEQIGNFPIERFRPDIRVSACVDELSIDPDAITHAPRCAFQNMRDT